MTDSQDWVVEGLIPKWGKSCLVGPPRSGRTLIALEMARCVGLGLPFAGRATRRSSVLYVSSNGIKQVEACAKGWASDGNPLPPVYFLDAKQDGLHLASDKGLESFLKETTLFPGLGLIVIDALSDIDQVTYKGKGVASTTHLISRGGRCANFLNRIMQYNNGNSGILVICDAKQLGSPHFLCPMDSVLRTSPAGPDHVYANVERPAGPPIALRIAKPTDGGLALVPYDPGAAR